MKELVCALADRLPGFPWDRMPELYRVGPLGVPQSFKIQHGEWGPPCIRQSDIDWELYSVVLIGCDVLLSILFVSVSRFFLCSLTSVSVSFGEDYIYCSNQVVVPDFPRVTGIYLRKYQTKYDHLFL